MSRVLAFLSAATGYFLILAIGLPVLLLVWLFFGVPRQWPTP